MYTLGIDIGSTTSKCAVLKDGKELVAHNLQTGGLGTGGPEEALAQLWQTSGLTRADMACAFVTGYGRKNYEGADGEISELTAHALGGRFVFPDLRTVIDIGGQDAKVIALSPSGKMVNFVMNDKCAAGTGRFLDVMASILRLDVDDLDAEAPRPRPPPLSPAPAPCLPRARSSARWPTASGAPTWWQASAAAWPAAWRPWPGGRASRSRSVSPAVWPGTTRCGRRSATS